jgi:hypothetical protein
MDFSSPPEYTKRFAAQLSNGHMVLRGELGHVEVMAAQPGAFRQLFERWFFEGVVDDSKYEYAPVDFTPAVTLGDMFRQMTGRGE